MSNLKDTERQEQQLQYLRQVERDRDAAESKLREFAAWADELETEGMGPGVVRRFLAQEIRRRLGKTV